LAWRGTKGALSGSAASASRHGVSGEGQTAGFVMSVVGAVVLLLGYHFIVRRQASA
jgi:uncharacterized membrane protein YeaQ/YmgE (transglycosylase-associated protein family)